MVCPTTYYLKLQIFQEPWPRPQPTLFHPTTYFVVVGGGTFPKLGPSQAKSRGNQSQEDQRPEKSQDRFNVDAKQTETGQNRPNMDYMDLKQAKTSQDKFPTGQYGTQANPDRPETDARWAKTGAEAALDRPRQTPKQVKIS